MNRCISLTLSIAAVLVLGGGSSHYMFLVLAAQKLMSIS